jgi:hypothetical protein
MFLIYFSNKKDEHNCKTPFAAAYDLYSAGCVYTEMCKAYKHVTVYIEETNSVLIKHLAE